MINTNTVFVLGAGASAPFGFPVGSQLVSQLCEELGQSTGDLVGVLKQCGHALETLNLVSRDLERSALSSIDRFLAMRSGAQEIGRQAIVFTISQYQDERRLSRTARDEAHRPIIATADWYGYLWNQMIAGVYEAKDIFARNRVKFITFNYDVSLERCFFNSLRALNVPDAEAGTMIRKLPIYHVYGSIERPPRKGVEDFDYRPMNDPQLVRLLSDNIKVMPHERPAVDAVCSSMLTEADQIFFLGFGFDEMNCARLGIEQALADRYRQTGRKTPVIATVKGLREGERLVAYQRIGGNASVLAGDEKATSLDVLRDHANLLR